jgi:VWFA-related protein
MLLTKFSVVVALCGLAAALEVPAYTQSTGSAPPLQQPVYTLHADTRVVLTDVTVSDRKGNPVHGLDRSVFHIFDNDKSQNLASFEEHTGAWAAAPMPTPPAKAGVYSNDFLLHPPPVFNVLVIDLLNVSMPDQMYLSYELTHFLNHLQDGESLAIYLHWGHSVILLQNFTSDRALLLDAVKKALPRFPAPGHAYISQIEVLHQIVFYLSQLPGRKNVLWFSSVPAFNFLIPDPSTTPNNEKLRPLYDELEASRIAVYPIDARGLTLGSNFGLNAQHFLLNDIAAATGGRAFYADNDITKIASRVMESDGSFYTLSYSPHDFRFDNKWHKVRVAVDGGSYQLSYRRGYFADGNNAEHLHPDKPRIRLLENGETAEEQPDIHSAPVIFQAQVLPVSGSPGSPVKNGTIPYSIRYSLPLDEFNLQKVDGKQQATIGVAALAFDRNGSTVVKLTQKVVATFSDEKLHINGEPAFTFEQRIDLKTGENFVYLGVWDMSNGHFGTIQLSVQTEPQKN